MITDKDIYNKLSSLEFEKLEVRDETESHIGHAAYKEGISSHFEVIFISSKLYNMPKIRAHKLIYELLDKELSLGLIHALSIKILNGNDV